MIRPFSQVPCWLAAALVLAAALAGCSPSAQISGTVAVTAMNIPDSDASGWTARVVCTRGKHQIIHSFAVADTSLAAELSVPAGTWDITLELADAAGTIVYQDSAVGVVIYPNRPTTIDFQLKPGPGTVKVIVDLAGHPHADNIMRARIYFNDKVYELVRSSAAEVLEGEYQLPPGSYDFTVDLYTSSFHAHNKIDPGLWTMLDVKPLSTQTVIWRPALETMAVTARICLLPDAPQHLVGQYNSQQVLLVWEPCSAADLEGYNVYWQPSPFQPFILIGTVDQHTTSFHHDLGGLDEIPLQAYYTVAPFSAFLEGYRSPPVLVPFF